MNKIATLTATILLTLLFCGNIAFANTGPEMIAKIKARKEAEYKEAFKRNFPKLEGLGNSEYLRRLEIALVLGLPYHTKEEETKLKAGNEKIKAEYQKKFGEPISSNELSTIRVNFWTEDYYTERTYFSVARTTSGAIVKYRPLNNTKLFTIELDLGEWLDFVRALHKCNINKWEKKYGGYFENSEVHEWDLAILSLDKNELKSIGYSVYPSNWDEFKKTIDNIKTKVRKDAATEELENKLKTEYEKKYGKITDFELFAEQAIFYWSAQVPQTISVARTKTGAVVKYYLDSEYNLDYGYSSKEPEDLSLELDMGEWLDFMRALYKNRVNEWKRKYYEMHPLRIQDRWTFKIYSSNGDKPYFKGYDIFPPNWNEFKKIINSIGNEKKMEMRAKIEAKLKLEYEKKFGMPITDAELSTMRIDVGLKDSKMLSELNHFSALRTASGAIVRYEQDANAKPLELELNIDEWLDFVRALYKCNINKWEKKYGEWSVFGNEERILNIYSLDKNLFKFSVFSNSNAYPPNWTEFNKVIDDMVARIKKKAGVK